MQTLPITQDAYRLLHEGAEACAEVEATGMLVDLPYLRGKLEEIGKQIESMGDELKQSEEYKNQRKRFGSQTKLTSRDQLAAVLVRDYGIVQAGCGSLDESVLVNIGSEYCLKFLELEKLRKLHSTYLIGVLRETEEDGILRPSFNLHSVVTYRSSSSDPNFQNIPIRNKEIARTIRTAFVPRPGCVLIEADYSAQEVRVACALSGDPRLTADSLHGDMHRDMAAECFMLDKDLITKPLRSAAKGGFVFAEFYGDWYKQVAKNLWSAVGQVAANGVVVGDHLADMGIGELGACNPDPRQKPVEGTFEHHIQRVENRFWNERFKVYHKYRQDLVAAYARTGWFSLVTGFVCQGFYGRNQIINYPIQGPAFHCLLWSLIRIVKHLRRHKMKSRVIGQIHDCIVADVHRSEVDDYVELVERVSTRDIADEWDWVTVPLAVEVEVCERNWFEKVPYRKGEVGQPRLGVCVACGGTGRNSRGGPCVPCSRRSGAA